MPPASPWRSTPASPSLTPSSATTTSLATFPSDKHDHARLRLVTRWFLTGTPIASGWAASAGQGRQAASQASAFYLLACYLGSSVFGAFGTNLWESGRWPAVAVMAGALLLTAAATGGAQALQTRPGQSARG